MCFCSRTSKPFAFLYLTNCCKRPYYSHFIYFVYTCVYGGPAVCQAAFRARGQDTPVLRRCPVHWEADEKQMNVSKSDVRSWEALKKTRAGGDSRLTWVCWMGVGESLSEEMTLSGDPGQERSGRRERNRGAPRPRLGRWEWRLGAEVGRGLEPRV